MYNECNLRPFLILIIINVWLLINWHRLNGILWVESHQILFTTKETCIWQYFIDIQLRVMNWRYVCVVKWNVRNIIIQVISNTWQLNIGGRNEWLCACMCLYTHITLLGGSAVFQYLVLTTVCLYFVNRIKNCNTWVILARHFIFI